MSDRSEPRIPDDRMAEAIAEAARLHAKENEGHLLTDLQQIGAEAGISSRMLEKALQKTEAKRLRKQARQRQIREFIKLITLFLTYVSILSVGITLFLIHSSFPFLVVAVLIAATAPYSIFISIQKPLNEPFIPVHSRSRIPEDVAAEALAEAAQLQAEKSEGQSLLELQKICAEAGIPPHTVEKAFREIEERLRCNQAKRQKRQEYVRRHAPAGIAVATGFLTSTTLFMHGIAPSIPIIFLCIFAGIALLADASAERKVIFREDFRKRGWIRPNRK